MRSVWFLILFGSLITYHCFTTASGEEIPSQQPSYSQCKPYVDAALKGETPQPPKEAAAAATSDSTSTEKAGDDDDDDSKEDNSKENDAAAAAAENDDDDSKEAGEAGVETDDDSTEEDGGKSDGAGAEDHDDKDNDSKEDQTKNVTDKDDGANDTDEDSKEEVKEGGDDSKEDDVPSTETAEDSKEGDDDDSKEQAQPEEGKASVTPDGPDGDSGEDSKEEKERDSGDSDNVANQADQSDSDESEEDQKAQESQVTAQATKSTETVPVATSADDSKENDDDSKESDEKKNDSKEGDDSKEDDNDSDEDDSVEEDSFVPRSREHLDRILALDQSEPTQALSALIDKATQTTLKELKIIYETAIKPLETMYKYRDLSNRHFGDPEIFSKPMVVFMGPWSGGKSTILNWLLGIENQDAALRTGADPSPAQFNILTHGSEDEVLDGTQLAADWTFSGLQKFGQAFLDRLRGRKLPNRLLEKVNLVEIPGILEVRKQVERSFPFNDACQWFIDRADVLFLVYDPAKLDIGPETEAILDQLKGRENQVRIVLNKADTVKPDELLRLQATLIWNISPLMASAEPPILYVASLWGRPLNPDSPTSLLVAHENNFLKDIRDATERRVETRIAAARRFAVRVRNHGKMCDCYLNTYNNHRSFFSNKKKISDDIVDHPQNYHIYEGLSTLTNISRYDLPDPDTYRDFFRLNPLWEFPTLASTCTYFRGCPINKLDIAIAYDLPELLGRYRRQRESILSAQQQQTSKPKHK